MREHARAKVLDVVDPEKRGRIRVSCDAIAMKGQDVGEWVEAELGFAAGSRCLFLLPPVGSWIDLHYQGEDPSDEYSALSFMTSPQYRWRASGWEDKSEVPATLGGKPYGSRLGLVVGEQWLIFDTAASAAILAAGAIRLGSDEANNPVVLGDLLQPLLVGLVDAITSWANTHTHVSALPGLPTGPSVPPIDLAANRADLSGTDWLSDKVLTEK